ncbi:MAG: 2-oxoacid:acceptor oxidoreductase family protein [Desulfobacterales bacterium]|nr:2-oxoacid:acceptor oxidoreductase family protein [Desulfobacterales bacterium]
MQRVRMVFSGSGGQGVITAAIIFAEAAVIHEGLNATQSQAYGAAARGGATRTDIIISQEEINYPKVIQPNVLVCLTQEAYGNYATIIRPGGLLLTDERFVKTARKVDARQVELPMYSQVMEKIGKPIVFNICMLGAVLALTDLVKPESIMKVLEQRIPSGFVDMNRKALDLGMELGQPFKR